MKSVRIAAVIAAALLVVLCIAPICAFAASPLEGDNWADQNPDFANFYQINPSAIDYYALEYIAWIANYAYKGGMFGGGIPVAITTRGNSSGGAWLEIIVLNAPKPTSATAGGDGKEESRDGATLVIGNLDNSLIANVSISKLNDNQSFVIYRVTTTGDLVPVSIANSLSLIASPDGRNVNAQYNILAIRTGAINNEYGSLGSITTGETGLENIAGWHYSNVNSSDHTDIQYWFTTVTTAQETSATAQWAEIIAQKIAINASVYSDGYEDGLRDGEGDGYDLGFSEGYENGEVDGYHNGFAAGEEQGYNDGYEDGRSEVAPVTLDIPSIFTGMFSGVHNILDGFDLEIFGISIVGTLMGVTVIAIVAFVIRKLTK